MTHITLVLGGQKSGKSAAAESMFSGGGVYIATGKADDAEMTARILAHQATRGADWSTLEESVDLATALNQAGGKPVLIDSLGMWVSNLLYAEKSPKDEAQKLAKALNSYGGPVVIVSDVVGLGVIPMNALARSFVDDLGLVNQVIASTAQRVILVTAGISQILKDDAP